MKLLHIDSSILGTQSATRELGAAIVGKWQRENPRSQIRYLDLAREPLGHLTGELLGARSAPAGHTEPAGQPHAALVIRTCS